VHKCVIMASVAVLAAAIMAPANAAPANVIKYVGVLTDPTMCPTAHGYADVGIISPGYVVQDGDKLVYDVLVDTNSTLNGGSLDMLHMSGAPGGGTLRDSWATDQYGRFAHPGTDYTNEPVGNDGKPLFVRGQWFHREISLTASGFPILDHNKNVLKDDPKKHLQDGATLNDWSLTFDFHDSTHKQDVCPTDTKNANVIFYVRHVNIVDRTGAIKQALYNGEGVLPGNKTMLTAVTGKSIDADKTNTGYGLPAGTKSVTITIAADPAATSATNPTAGE
jgi:hypothetical protein